MPKKYQQPDKIVVINGPSADLYRLQRLPGSTNLLINNNYQGVKIINPWQNGKELLKVNFTSNYDSSGCIDGWCLRADGKAVLVMHFESGKASLLSLEPGGRCYDLAVPSLKHLDDLRYYWDSDSFWLTGGQSIGFYKLELEGDQPVWIETSGFKARLAQTRWSREVDKIPTYDHRVLKIVPDQGEILYWGRVDDTQRIGMSNWLTTQHWSAPAPQDNIGMAYYNDRMFLLFDEECTVIDEQGRVEAVYPLILPSPYEYRIVEILPAKNGNPAALLLGAVAQSEDGLHYQIMLYKLN